MAATPRSSRAVTAEHGSFHSLPDVLTVNLDRLPRCSISKAARAVALRPEVLLLDEPTSALDSISTAKVEELVAQLKTEFTIVIVTHNMQQVSRISDNTAFMYLGELVECGPTAEIFQSPKVKRTEDYITGRYG